jgi:hypothetical protein
VIIRQHDRSGQPAVAAAMETSRADARGAIADSASLPSSLSLVQQLAAEGNRPRVDVKWANQRA